MDFSDLNDSDAGDSGWTMYLDHSSSVSLHHFDYHNGDTKQEHDDDSSMVSDASSGPPYYCEETVPEDLLQQNTQYWCKSKSKIKNKNKNKNKNKKKVHEEQGYSERFNSSLDDTASSLGKFNSGFLQQAFPVDKLGLDNQGGSNQRKRRG
ncbi:hypothetical protein ARALYDRAFT_315379 [Arabidopsis lyrata subsp. lyrata]|uniref:Uncharacterized protein n=1 Tax=Arabidopsis lyrata subsp. lyrata TaxID=81972 RepID=D7KY53_ARALL|nr:hypothetical protein ARALYDRAFT_315379 [Arabidopsis lyrata subsp. lyrata]